MEKHPVASPELDPTDATLKAVSRAWLVIQEQRRLFDEFRKYVPDEKLRHDAKSTASAVNGVKWQIEDFCEQFHHLEVALLTSEQDRRLRWMYDPHCVSCKGNVPEPLSRHDSYSQAVYRFAWQTFLALPFIESPEMRELHRRGRKPGSPLPKVAFDKVFHEFRDEQDAATGIKVETGQERACHDKYSVTSSPVPFESSCEIYAEVRERILATYFDTAELELLVRREYAAVADRLGAKQDAPSEFSCFRTPNEWEWVFDNLKKPLSWKTIRRYIHDGKLRAIKDSTKSVSIAKDDLRRYVPGYDDTLNRAEETAKTLGKAR